jgi:pSer/pThr/pTyr-binding forkhead associated (FHA) protein
MAKLERIADGSIRALSSRCLVGRSPQADLVIDQQYVSADHASIQWNGSHWEIRDLASSNGTFVDGERVGSGKRVPLTRGARLGFGGPDAQLVLVDASAPVALVIRVADGAIKHAEREMIALPDDESVEATIYLGPTGWVLESGIEEPRPVQDRELLVIGAHTYRLELPLLDESTPIASRAMTLASTTLRFTPGPALSLVSGGQATPLEWRWHTPLLLELAKARNADRGGPTDEAGWREVDELAESLGMNPKVLNVATHQARQQLAGAGLEGAAWIVEVRRGWRRLGTARVEISS